MCTSREKRERRGVLLHRGAARRLSMNSLILVGMVSDMILIDRLRRPFADERSENGYKHGAGSAPRKKASSRWENAFSPETSSSGGGWCQGEVGGRGGSSVEAAAWRQQRGGIGEERRYGTPQGGNLSAGGSAYGATPRLPRPVRGPSDSLRCSRRRSESLRPLPHPSRHPHGSAS